MWSGQRHGRCRLPAAGCEESPDTPVPSHELNRRRPAGMPATGRRLFFLFCVVSRPLRPLKIQNAWFSSQDKTMQSNLMKDLIDTEKHHH